MKTSAQKANFPMHWLAVFCLSVLLGAAQAQTGSITGQVMAADTREPLAGAAVEISGPALAGKKGAIADEKGQYTIENVPAGTYTLKVTHVGYVAGTVRKVNVTQGTSVEVDFRLESAPYALRETVVSASRRAENIVDAPVSISKVDAKEIARNSAGNTFVSAIKNVKGIDYTQRGILNESFNARGLNAVLNTRMLSLIDGALFYPTFRRRRAHRRRGSHLQGRSSGCGDHCRTRLCPLRLGCRRRCDQYHHERPQELSRNYLRHR